MFFSTAFHAGVNFIPELMSKNFLRMRHSLCASFEISGKAQGEPAQHRLNRYYQTPFGGIWQPLTHSDDQLWMILTIPPTKIRSKFNLLVNRYGRSHSSYTACIFSHSLPHLLRLEPAHAFAPWIHACPGLADHNLGQLTMNCCHGIALYRIVAKTHFFTNLPVNIAVVIHCCERPIPYDHNK